MKEILNKYNTEYNLVNKAEPHQKRISTFIAAELKTDNDTFEML